MADCGAAGTTVDRAVRAAMGGGQHSNEAAKQLSSLIGHTTMGPGQAMPASAPNHLSLHSSAPIHVHHSLENARVVDNPNALNHQNGQMLSGQAIQGPYHNMMTQPAPVMLPPGIQQQQAMHAMFHHQQQVMQYQLQVMAAQQAQQNTSKSAIEFKTRQDENAEVHGDKWQEGLEDEVKDFLKDQDDGHEGVVPGASIEELAAAWAEAEAEYDAEYSQLHSQEEEDFSNLWTSEMPQDQAKPYEFTNKETPSEVLDWMEEGMRHFREGDLKDAIKSFEMELQHNNPENSIAWRMLGRCYAESDQDADAIKCLEASVDRDPFSPESLLALGVSYVNELNYERALQNMKEWFTHNPKYADMGIDPDVQSAAAPGTESAFDEVKGLLLRALEYDPTDAADVLEALGVIFNVIRDYDAAADSFRKALESRPDDYQLWNKLGATLANGNQSDQALSAYHKAIEIKPKYARAWLNMAISHSNLRDHHEAARCYLQTLSLNPDATHCWTYLRMALSSSERWDLLPLVFAQDLQAFKQHFDFVQP